VTSIDAGGGSTVERVDPFDFEGLAREFAARDAGGRGLGMLSPRDTTRATVAGAEIIIDYSRPSARGRTVMGGLVPYDATWRTGANNATQLTTSAPLRIGDVHVEPGSYSLFTIPRPGAWDLIINREVGMSGLEHDPARDVGRVRLEPSARASHTEQFTIRLDPTAGGALLRIMWGDADVAVPVQPMGDHEHPPGDEARLGRVTFPVSCAEAVRPQVERAVAMLHSFWFESARSAFTTVITADPQCAMAHWGLAITRMGNPMTRATPPPAALAEGAAAAERATRLGRSATHREQMYIAAAAAYYADHETRDHLTRMRSLEEAFAALHQAHPEDMEAAIFHARTIVANASPADRTFASQLRGAAIMQPLFDANPEHPGLAHYLIHAYDVPQLADRGTRAARAYADIAPAAPHALHMPSHIFTRLGYWDESIETNARSARAEPDSNAAVHPLDYMVYAYLQQGRDADARRVVERVVQIADSYYGGLLGYNFAAMPARLALERGAWADAAALRLPVGAAPYVQAVTHFARAIGAARTGDAAAAQAEVDALARLKAALDDANDSYWSTVVESQRLAGAAWVARARGNDSEAVRLARAAAELEETVEKHPVTPGPLLPARELEGDLLLELGRPADALAAYDRTLEREPRRARALFGAARAAAQAGNADVATARYREILDVMAAGDPTRPEIVAARQYLAGR
jgi:tetratricopeptide (TPR) repeat protein